MLCKLKDCASPGDPSQAPNELPAKVLIFKELAQEQIRVILHVN
jgi:hypothetical protein